MNKSDETSYLLHDAEAYLRSKSIKFSNINLESIKHFSNSGKLKISVKLENAVGRESDREYKDAQSEYEPDDIRFVPEEPSIEEIHFPNNIIVNLVGIGTVFHGMRYFIYEDKEFVLESCSSRIPVILKSELDRFISSNRDKSIDKKIRLSSRTANWNGRPVTPKTKEKYEKWQEAVKNKHKKSPLLSHFRICTLLEEECETSSANLQRITSLK